MSYPIHNRPAPLHIRQTVFLNDPTPPSFSSSTQTQRHQRDSLQMSSASQQCFSCCRHLLKTILLCLTSFFSCCFKVHHNSNELQKTICYLAARDQFIWFYKQEENPLTAFLGNFHACPIEFRGIRFACAEAAYQAEKFFPQQDLMQRFQHLNGESAFRLGRELSRQWTPQQRHSWQQRSLEAMRFIVAAKFAQNPHLANLLLATGSAYLVEHLPVTGRDGYWGDNGNGTGQNMLGQILMETRGALGGIGVVPRNHQYNQFLLSLP